MGVSLGVSREDVRLAALATTLAAAMYLVVRSFGAELPLPSLPWNDAARESSVVALYEPAAAEAIERPRVAVERARRAAPVGGSSDQTVNPRTPAQREAAPRLRGDTSVGAKQPPRAKPGVPEPQPGPTQRNGGTPAEGGRPSAESPPPTAPLILEVPTVTPPLLTAPLEPVLQPVTETVEQTVEPVLPPAPTLPVP